MQESPSLTDSLEILAGILIRSFAVGVIFALLWFLFFLIGGDAVYALHAKWFPITKRDYDLLNYCGMAGFKILNLLIFLFPYLAVRMVMRQKKDHG